MKTKNLQAALIALSISLAPVALTAQTSTTNPAANKSLSEPRNSTDGAILKNHSNNIDYGRNTWRQVQEKLNDSNFPVGRVDGMSGPKTTEAIRNYQRSQNLEVTGRLNQETLDRMDIDYSNDVPANQRLSE